MEIELLYFRPIMTLVYGMWSGGLLLLTIEINPMDFKGAARFLEKLAGQSNLKITVFERNLFCLLVRDKLNLHPQGMAWDEGQFVPWRENGLMNVA